MPRSSPSPSAAVRAVRVVKLVGAALLVVGLLVVGLSRTHAARGGDQERPRDAAAGRPTTGERLAPCSDHTSDHTADRTATSARTPAAAADGDDVAAVVRRPGGRVLTVPFEEGWRVYQGRLPGTLVAVCRGAAAPTDAR